MENAPILNREELIRTADAARSRGENIILTNGCFDLFHVGHVRYLAGAKALGGFVITAINSDRQVRVLKGESRPFMPENERAELVAALRSVDAVTVFDEPTVEQVIEAIRPDIHAKGTDYTEDNVPEREIVTRLGGKVAIVGDPKDHSSTDLLAAIRGK
ncbi:MAG TPA: adenylyltransferase/cytidyltransferase family protein [Pyrinomonadaceae bacterium]|nr:adenylyltransferase/cytidyltransferase family protein [Pyrinomonadaceae bacterium]